MNSEIILLALSPVFLVFVCFEFVKFKRYYNIKDSLANTVLALLHQGADAMALLLLMPFFYMLYEYRLFDIKLSSLIPLPLAIVKVFVFGFKFFFR